MEVVGRRGVIVMDLAEATSDPAAKGFNLKNARLTYLDRGDAFDLQTRQVSPSEQKRAERTINPNSADFAATRDDTIVTSEIWPAAR